MYSLPCEFDTLGAAASDATGPTTDLGKALQEVREGADGGIAKYASGLSATRSAVDGVTSAIERRTQAEKKLADLNDPVKRNERVADALDRVASAEDTLSDSIIRRRKAQEQLDALMKRSVVAGSVPLVQDITEAADDLQTDVSGTVYDQMAVVNDCPRRPFFQCWPRVCQFSQQSGWQRGCDPDAAWL